VVNEKQNAPFKENSTPAKYFGCIERTAALESMLLVGMTIAEIVIVTARNGISIWEKIVRAGWPVLGIAGLCGLTFGFVRWKWLKAWVWRKLSSLINFGLAYALVLEFMSRIAVSDPWVGLLVVIIQFGITGMVEIVLSQMFCT
jgi:hypothetical protein